jgi:hypothetical protein
MEVEVCPPGLHDKLPVKPEAVKVEEPQLLTTLTEGAAGTVSGAAVPLPAGLSHPPTVWVTV